jgi:threonine dehydrogenase-like Zn-dependent dehydrogenase
MEVDCLIEYHGPGYFPASLSEPMSCVIGAFHAIYHTTHGSYEHHMGIRVKGNMALLAGAGPMGLGAIDYALHCDRRPGLLVVTDIDEARLKRAEELFPAEAAEKAGVKLMYVNTGNIEKAADHLVSLTEGKGYDDVFVYAPVKPVIEMGDAILGRDGCLNFFAGPTTPDYSALINFYNVHYGSTHVMGTTGGNTDDMREALDMMTRGLVNPAGMVTHIGGLDSAVETTMNLPNIPGGKKLIYTNIEMELTAIEDFGKKSGSDPRFKELARMCENRNGLWSVEAEEYLLKNF